MGLNRLSRPNRVEDLVDDEKGDAESAESPQSRRVVVIGSVNSGDQQNKNCQMRESLGVLSGVDRAHAKGKESSENSGYSWVGSTADRWRGWGDLPSCRRGTGPGNLRPWNECARSKCARNESRRSRGNAFHFRSQTVLAIDHAPHGTCTDRAQCLSASAAIGHC